MSLRAALSAFAFRGARRRGAVWSMLGYSALVTALLLLLAAWLAPAGRADDLYRQKWDAVNAMPDLWTTTALADVYAVWLLALALLVIVPAVVAAAMGQERRAGTLDQLRTTPLPPLGLVLGFVLGVPARVYLLCVGPLLLHVAVTLSGPAPLTLTLGSLAFFVAGSIASSLVALCLTLAPRQDGGGALTALVVAAVLGIGGLFALGLSAHLDSVGFAFVHPFGGISSLLGSERTLWRRLMMGSVYGDEPFASSERLCRMLYCHLATIFVWPTLALLLARAACRKLAAPQQALLSKSQALGLGALAIVPVVVPFWNERPLGIYGAWPLTVAYALGALLLGLLATPSYEVWALARRRATRTRWWQDAAAPHGMMWLMQLGWVLALWPFWRDRASSVELLPVTLAWATLTLGSLPLFVHFCSTRYQTTSARVAFGTAMLVHLIVQAIAIPMAASTLDGMEAPFVGIAALAGLLVPAWVAWRQRALGQLLVAR